MDIVLALFLTAIFGLAELGFFFICDHFFKLRTSLIFSLTISVIASVLSVTMIKVENLETIMWITNEPLRNIFFGLWTFGIGIITIIISTVLLFIYRFLGLDRLKNRRREKKEKKTRFNLRGIQ